MCSEAAHLRDEKSSDGKSLSPGTVSPFSTRSRSASCATNIVGTPCLPPPNGVRLFRLEESRIWNEKTTHNTVHFSRIVVRIVSTALNVSLRPPPPPPCLFSCLLTRRRKKWSGSRRKDDTAAMSPHGQIPQNESKAVKQRGTVREPFAGPVFGWRTELHAVPDRSAVVEQVAVRERDSV
mgnify:FL=1